MVPSLGSHPFALSFAENAVAEPPAGRGDRVLARAESLIVAGALVPGRFSYAARRPDAVADAAAAVVALAIEIAQKPAGSAFKLASAPTPGSARVRHSAALRLVPGVSVVGAVLLLA